MEWTVKKIENAETWPCNNGTILCCLCELPYNVGEVVFGARSMQRGTFSFHKGCLLHLSSLKTPDTEAEEIRKLILKGEDYFTRSGWF